MAQIETYRNVLGRTVRIVRLTGLDIEALAEEKVVTQPGGGRDLIAVAPYGVHVDPERVARTWEEEE